MDTSGPATFSRRSFYWLRARAQRDRPHVQFIEPDFGDSGKESDYDEDEDEANIPEEESDYSSPSEDESGDDSCDNDVDVVDDDNTEY